jgi:hypothetical protein
MQVLLQEFFDFASKRLVRATFPAQQLMLLFGRQFGGSEEEFGRPPIKIGVHE